MCEVHSLYYQMMVMMMVVVVIMVKSNKQQDKQKGKNFPCHTQWFSTNIPRSPVSGLEA